MQRSHAAQKFVSCILCGALLFSGCTTRDYQLVKEEDYVPPPLLGHEFTDEHLTVELLHLIAYQSPGSWKLDALWDEYIFGIQNNSGQTVEFGSLVIVDPLGEIIPPNLDVWSIHKENPGTMRRYKREGIPVTKDVPTELLVAGAVVGVGLQVGASAAMGSAMAAGGYSSLYAIGAVTFVVLPAVLIIGAGTMVKNSKARDVVRDEVQLRYLDLRSPLPAGESIQGSLFFPIIPSPEYFELRYTVSLPEGPLDHRTLEGSLSMFAGLHEIIESDD